MRSGALLAGMLVVVGCGEPPAGSDASSGDTQDVASIDTGVDAPPDATSDAIRDAADSGAMAMCGPTWQPTACHDCGGMSNGTTCTQPCMSCDDGHLYRAECDSTSGMCRCFIDNVEACTCTIHIPIGAGACEPEAFGGSNCCWNVG